MVEAQWRTPACVLQGLSGESLVVAVDEAEKITHFFSQKLQEGLADDRGEERSGWAHLNWQKISAYSAEMLEACSTVTLKVNRLPTFRCSSDASRAPSRQAFSGFSGSSAPAAKK